MEIEKQEMISQNITCVFRNPNLKVDLEELRKKIEGAFGEAPEIISLETPIQYHIFNLPSNKLIITIEDSRLIVEDRTRVESNQTKLVDVFEKIYSFCFNAFELGAYGYNYVAQFTSGTDTDFALHAPSILNQSYVESIKVIGFETGLRFSKNGVIYQAKFVTLSPRMTGLTFNIHRDANQLPESNILRAQFNDGFSECRSFAANLN